MLKMSKSKYQMSKWIKMVKAALVCQELIIMGLIWKLKY